MDAPEQDAHYEPRIGLCSVCRYARVVNHPRGGTPYYQCVRAEDDPRFDKFPAVPVRACEGYRQKDPIE